MLPSCSVLRQEGSAWVVVVTVLLVPFRVVTAWRVLSACRSREFRSSHPSISALLCSLSANLVQISESWLGIWQGGRRRWV